MVARVPNPPEATTSERPPERSEVVYPDCDGEPMSDNTLQFSWIVLLKENLDASRADFVAGDLLWYPVEGRPDVRAAPDVLVAVGRPKGHRGSYKQWVEGQPPTVVMEVLSPGNTTREMMRKSYFYGSHGARELIIIDPERGEGWAFIYGDRDIAEEVGQLDGWTSPTLGIRFERHDGVLRVRGPDDALFEQLGEAQARARAEAERARAEAERARAEAERAERLAAKLRELGVDPDA